MKKSSWLVILIFFIENTSENSLSRSSSISRLELLAKEGEKFLIIFIMPSFFAPKVFLRKFFLTSSTSLVVLFSDTIYKIYDVLNLTVYESTKLDSSVRCSRSLCSATDILLSFYIFSLTLSTS